MSNGNGNRTDSEPATDPDLAGPLRGRTVALCVTGSVAAYKAVEFARLLLKAGATVLPVMTSSASRFVGPITLAGICGKPVATNMWDPSFAGEMHVAIANRADLVAIVPATADVLARLAQGRADDLVTALALSAKGPVLAAPAMHPRMWNHPATQRNIATLAEQGRVTLAGPVRGEVASGDEGMGRMAEPAAIVAAAAALIESGSTPAAADLRGFRVLVTAGPTLEDLDPVRFLGNRSSGKMGFAIAARAAARGAQVTLVAGPVGLATPPGVRRVDVRGALDMRAALWRALKSDLSGADALIMAAAVADHRPAETSAKKLKKSEAKAVIELVKNPDLLAEIGAARAALASGASGASGASRGARRPALVGFAVETGDDDAVVAYARKKLEAKRVDLIVCNEAKDSFGRDDNRIGLVTACSSGAIRALPALVARARAATKAPTKERGRDTRQARQGSVKSLASGASDASGGTEKRRPVEAMEPLEPMEETPAVAPPAEVEFLPTASKEALADVILTRVRALL